MPQIQGATDTDFSMKVKRMLTFFARVNVNDFTDGSAREFCGTNAVLRQFTSIKAKIDKKIDIQLADLAHPSIIDLLQSSIIDLLHASNITRLVF